MYFAVHLENNNHFVNLECFGLYLNYFVYKVEQSTLVRLEFANKRCVFLHEEKIALSSKFAGARRDFIRVSGDFEQLKKQWPENLLIPHKPNKWTYYLTNEDKTNAIVFMKIIIRDMIFKHYENMYLINSPHSSTLHKNLKMCNDPNQLLQTYVEEINRLVGELDLLKDIDSCNNFVEQFEQQIGL